MRQKAAVPTGWYSTDASVGVKDHVVVAERILVALTFAFIFIDEEVRIGAILNSQETLRFSLFPFTVFVQAVIE